MATIRPDKFFESIVKVNNVKKKFKQSSFDKSYELEDSFIPDHSFIQVASVCDESDQNDDDQTLNNTSIMPALNNGINFNHTTEFLRNSLEITLKNSCPLTTDCVFIKAARNETVKCQILKVRSQLQPKFIFFLETKDEKFPLLFSLTKFLNTSIYAIKTSENKTLNLDDKSSRALVARFKTNLLRTEYELNRVNSIGEGDAALKNLKIINRNRKKMLINKPLKLRTFINDIISNDSGTSNLEFITKKPFYDEKDKLLKLDFQQRAKMLSRKNFQLVDENDTETIIMQLGKLSDDLYSCDFSYPFSACQAFAIALSVFV